MSTPSGKPPHLIELAAYLARQAGERAASKADERAASKADERAENGNGDRPRSPYAPKPAHERAARLRVLANNDNDHDTSPYASIPARAAQAGETSRPKAKALTSAPEARKER